MFSVRLFVGGGSLKQKPTQDLPIVPFVALNDEHGKYVCCYYIDFYFPSKKLIIELDGAHHKKQKEYDKKRDEYIKSTLDCEIIRIPHDEYVARTMIPNITDLLKG
jgi:very-short-patch-repair endonuclease